MGEELAGEPSLSEADVRRLIEETLKKYGLLDEASEAAPGPRAEDARLPGCPHAKIVALYHEKLPELPACKVSSEQRQAKTRGFWRWVLTSTKSDGTRRAETAEQALDWIGQYFARASRNDLVMGRVKASAEHANWVASYDYLISPRGRVQVIERTRERKS